jgi:peptidoglycan/LPS O-acetylase OafA/YrhL
MRGISSFKILIHILFHMFILVNTKQMNDLEINCRTFAWNLITKNGLFNNTLFLNSGTNMNDLGLYSRCIKEDNYTYSLMRTNITIENKPLFAYVGLCMPKVCELEEIFIYIKQEFQRLSDLKANNVDFIKSKEKNDELSHMYFDNYFFVCIFSLYFIAASGIIQFIAKKYQQYINKWKNKRKNTLLFQLKEEETPAENDYFSVSSKEQKHIQKISQPVIEEQVENKILKENLFFKILDLINFQKNWRKLFDTKDIREGKDKGDQELKFLDAIRIFLSLFIVFMHSIVFLFDTPVRGIESFLHQRVKEFMMQLIVNGSYAVDLFFSFSGFFLSYIGLKKFKKKANSLNFFFQATFVRFIRIWPLLICCWVFFWKVFSLLGDGPIYGLVMGLELDSCSKQWPWILLLVQNWTYGIYETESPVCFGWYWYIPNDFQLTILGVIVIILYKKNLILFYLTFLGLIATGLVFEIRSLLLTRYGINILSQGMNSFQNFINYYILLYNRCSPFWIGMIFGIIYYKYKKELMKGRRYSSSINFSGDVEMHRRTSLINPSERESNRRRSSTVKKKSCIFKICQKIRYHSFLSCSLIFLGALMMLTVTFITYFTFDRAIPFSLEFTYNFLGRKAYSFGFQILCLGFMLDGLQPIRNMLSHHFFQTFSKLSFAIYIVHPIIIKFCYYSLKYSVYVKFSILIPYAIGYMITATIVAIFASVLFEQPCQRIKTASGKHYEERVSIKLKE